MSMVARRIIIVTLISALTVVGVLFFMKTAHAQTTILVHAGAGIRPALDEAGAAFQKKSGVRVDYNYKGSACLLPDVLMSGKGDVYIPGEEYYVKQAVDRKLVGADYKVVATMTTVIIAQSGNPKHIAGLQDLAKPGLRLGLGDPDVVACGRAAKEALVNAGVWDEAKKNLVMGGQNVSEVSNAVRLGTLDAAIVWNATAALYTTQDLATIAIPAKYAVTSAIPVAVVTASKQRRAAQQFVSFLAGKEGRRIFLKHGFGMPPTIKGSAEPGGRRGG
jgi:molybdate transport system substrate-binding protein